MLLRRLLHLRWITLPALLLAAAPPSATAAAAPPDSVRIEEWLKQADVLINQKPNRTLALADSARRLAQARRLPQLEVKALALAATAAQLRADFPKATALAQEAYTLAQKQGVPSLGQWQAANLLVGMAYARQDWAETIKYAREQVTIAEVLGKPHLLAWSYNNLGSAQSEAHQYAEADANLKKAVEVARKAQLPAFETKSLVDLAYNEMYQDRLAQAVEYATTAMNTAERQIDPGMLATALNTRATVRSKLGQHAGAVADQERAIQLLRKNGHFNEEIQFRSELSGLYERAGMLDKALAAERRYWQLRDSTQSLEVQQQLNQLNTQFKTEQREARIAALSQAKKLADLRVWALLAGLVVVLAGAAVFGRQYVRLRRTQRALATTTRTKDRLYSVVAHDLRSPIASFPGLLDLLRRYRDRSATQDFDGLLTEMRAASQQVAQLLENLLQWAAGQHGELVVRPEPLPVQVLLAEAADLYTAAAAAAGKHLLLSPAPPDLLLRADRQMTRAILRNLTDNALKYLPAGGTVRLSAEATPGGGTVALLVSDDGLGLTGAQLAAFNATAAPVGGAATAEVRGTGLGLPLCRLLAERQNGRLLLISAPGQGLVARVELPVVG